MRKSPEVVPNEMKTIQDLPFIFLKVKTREAKKASEDHWQLLNKSGTIPEHLELRLPLKTIRPCFLAILSYLAQPFQKHHWKSVEIIRGIRAMSFLSIWEIIRNSVEPL